MSSLGFNVKKTYNDAPPSFYVPGSGRGAVGFTTRSDIGPALNTEEKKNVDLSESNYDKFSGYGGETLFENTPYDRDDEDADNIYVAVDEHMDMRRKRRREAFELEQLKKFRQERPKISDQFADLKRDLSVVSNEEWSSIPEIGDYSLKYKQRAPEVYTPLPDYLISQKLGKGSESVIDRQQQINGGFQTPMVPTAGGTSTVTDLAGAKGQVLTLKLDKMSDNVSGQTVVDPKGYLTDLNSLQITSDAEIGDIKKARALLKSVTSTNPKHAPGWIASSRIEEYAGKIVQARKIMKQACEVCPESEDVWIEFSRLHNPENAKRVLADAVRCIPTSVKIWMKAAELEG